MPFYAPSAFQDGLSPEQVQRLLQQRRSALETTFQEREELREEQIEEEESWEDTVRRDRQLLWNTGRQLQERRMQERSEVVQEQMQNRRQLLENTQDLAFRSRALKAKEVQRRRKLQKYRQLAEEMNTVFVPDVEAMRGILKQRRQSLSDAREELKDRARRKTLLQSIGRNRNLQPAQKQALADRLRTGADVDTVGENYAEWVSQNLNKGQDTTDSRQKLSAIQDRLENLRTRIGRAQTKGDKKTIEQLRNRKKQLQQAAKHYTNQLIPNRSGTGRSAGAYQMSTEQEAKRVARSVRRENPNLSRKDVIRRVEFRLNHQSPPKTLFPEKASGKPS